MRSILSFGQFCLCAVLLVAGCDRVESDWRQAEASHTADSYQAYINEHPDSPHNLDALDRIEALSWSEAKKAATVNAFEAYLTVNPKGRFRAEALSNIEALRWNQAKSSRTTTSLREYLNEYPNSPNKTDATQLIEELTMAGLKGLTYERVDIDTILITDGFFAEKITDQLGYETQIHIVDIKNGVFKTSGEVPLGRETAVGVTWVFDKPSLSFRAGKDKYIYQSKFAGATVKLTEKGVLVRGVTIQSD